MPVRCHPLLPYSLPMSSAAIARVVGKRRVVGAAALKRERYLVVLFAYVSVFPVGLERRVERAGRVVVSQLCMHSATVTGVVVTGSPSSTARSTSRSLARAAFLVLP